MGWQVWLYLPPQRQFVALSWLSLAGCTSAEPASVLPTNLNGIRSFLSVKPLFITMLFSWPFERLWQRLISRPAEHESLPPGREVCR